MQADVPCSTPTRLSSRIVAAPGADNYSREQPAVINNIFPISPSGDLIISNIGMINVNKTSVNDVVDEIKKLQQENQVNLTNIMKLYAIYRLIIGNI